MRFFCLVVRNPAREDGAVAGGQAADQANRNDAGGANTNVMI